ncbi:MAG: PAS domain S-box protein [Nitrospinae bacterium]|nr:PAS domain S-box protein [Nitrospinota bacterium]
MAASNAVSTGRMKRELEELRWRVTEMVRIAEERTNAESALSDSEAKYRDLVHSISEYLYSVQFTNGKQTAVYHSPQCEIITGYRPEDYYRDLDLWIKMVHPDDREKVTAFLRDAMAEKTAKSIEHRIIHKDGSVRWVSNHCTVTTDQSGASVRQNGFLLDITGLKETQRERDRLFAAIEQAADVVIITNTDGVIQYANPAFERVSGFTREEAVGKNPRLLKSGAHDDAFYKELWDTIASGKTWDGTFVNRRKDGSVYSESATISPIKDETGKVTNFVAVKRDVTRESAFVKARDYFTAVTSHELRSPLIKIDLLRMLVSRIESQVTDKETLSRINEVINNIYQCVDGVVSATTLISELNVPRGGDSFSKVLVYFMVQSSVESLKSSVEKEKRKLDIKMDLSRLPKDCSALGDLRLLTRAVNEALSNAAKYTPDGKSVNVTAWVDDAKAVVEVKDEGIGIAAEMQEKIFEPYFSLENPAYYTSSKHKFMGGGMGLGLTVARMIMEIHGGRLAIESMGEGKGTSVTLCMNLA